MTDRTVYLETFGCQMNELDSELVRGQLTALGYRFVASPDDASVVLYNTCSVREQAENKAFSRIGIVGARKREGESVILGVLGCMAERDGIDMMRRHPQVDLLCGPGELDKLPHLIDNAARVDDAELSERVALAGNKSRRTTTLAAAEDDLEALDLSRAFDADGDGRAAGRSAYVRITRGCNKFCTYCVVPYTRGAEVHRAPDAIVEECRRLVDAGVIEITLLGQTVNHYRYTHGASIGTDGRERPQVGPGLGAFRHPIAPGAGRITTFSDLLARIHDEVPALRRLRFVTSYPRDFTDEALSVIAASPRICPYLHVPAQSGSDRVLKLMNRGYTVSEYLEFIDRAISIVPDVSIAGDIIVGFPTETDEDFEATERLLRRVPFKNNFIFKYSPRPGTTAIDRFPDDVPEEVKRWRNNRLLAVQAEVSAAVHESWVGREVDVLVDRVTAPDAPTAPTGTRAGTTALTAGGRAIDSDQPERSAGTLHLDIAGSSRHPERARQVSGRTSGDLIVVFDAPDGLDPHDLIGTEMRVRIESSGALLLRGQASSAAARA